MLPLRLGICRPNAGFCNSWWPESICLRKNRFSIALIYYYFIIKMQAWQDRHHELYRCLACIPRARYHRAHTKGLLPTKWRFFASRSWMQGAANALQANRALIIDRSMPGRRLQEGEEAQVLSLVNGVGPAARHWPCYLRSTLWRQEPCNVCSDKLARKGYCSATVLLERRKRYPEQCLTPERRTRGWPAS